jgi:hypothetical protein
VFGKRAGKKREMTLVLRDGSGREVFCDNPSALELEEETMLRLSVRFFNDPEPCVIHRSAVVKRVAMELAEMLPGEGEYAVEELPAEAREYLAKYDAVSASLKNS